MNTETKEGDQLMSGTYMGRRYWVVDKVSKGFASMTELEWSRDCINEPGCMHRTDNKIRRKILNGKPYCRKLNGFRDLDEEVKILPDKQ